MLVGVVGDQPAAVGLVLDRLGALLQLAGVLDAGLVLGRQRQRYPELGVLHRPCAVVVVGDLHLDRLHDPVVVPACLLSTFPDRRQKLLGVELHALPRGADEPVRNAAGEACRHLAGGADVDRHRPGRRLVVERHVAGLEVLALEGDEVLLPQLAHQLHRFPEAAEADLELGPLHPRHGNLVHRLAGPDSEDQAPRRQPVEGCESLRHDRGVVAEGRRQDAGAERDPARPLGGRAQPRKGEGSMAVGVPEGLVVVGDPDAVEALRLGEHGQVEQLLRAELLRRRLVAELEGHLLGKYRAQLKAIPPIAATATTTPRATRLLPLKPAGLGKVKTRKRTPSNIIRTRTTAR